MMVNAEHIVYPNNVESSPAPVYSFKDLGKVVAAASVVFTAG